jgi:class 3 adenylate cyclase
MEIARRDPREPIRFPGARADADSRRSNVRTAIIVFADIVDSTALIERMGDHAFHARSTELEALLRAAIRDNGGEPVEGRLLGDGVLAVFESAREAILGSLDCAAAGANLGLPLHVGVHAGDVIRDDRTIYGGAVCIAARISEKCPPGDVLASETVRGLSRTSTEVTFADRGEHVLKGISEPIKLWSICGDDLPAGGRQA